MPGSAAASTPAANLALRVLFFLASRTPRLLSLLQPLAVTITTTFSPQVVEATRFNAHRICGCRLSSREQRRFTRGVIGNFFGFVVELGRSGRRSADQLLARVSGIEGASAYAAARAARRGAVLVTAHLGAFEVGLAALRQREPRVHVVFKRDEFEAFERIRARVRAMLNVAEAPIDDGLPGLVRLRDALLNDEVVVIQCDRAMPGQRWRDIPFFHGHLRMPTGPVRLAFLTGSPIIPVFVLPGPRGTFRVRLDEPISATPEADSADDLEDRALRAIARSLERAIGEDPRHWLVLERAFVEGSDSDEWARQRG